MPICRDRVGAQCSDGWTPGQAQNSEPHPATLLLASDVPRCHQTLQILRAVPEIVTSNTVAEELVKFFARVGIPEEILTDHGTNFTSQLLQELYRLLSLFERRHIIRRQMALWSDSIIHSRPCSGRRRARRVRTGTSYYHTSCSHMERSRKPLPGFRPSNYSMDVRFEPSPGIHVHVRDGPSAFVGRLRGCPSRSPEVSPTVLGRRVCRIRRSRNS